MFQSQTQNARRLASKRSRKLLGAAVAAVGPVLGVSKWASAQLYIPYLNTSDSGAYRLENGDLALDIQLSNGGSYNVGQDAVWYAIDTVDTTLANATSIFAGSGPLQFGTTLGFSSDPTDEQLYTDVTEDTATLGNVNTGTGVTTWWVWIRVHDSVSGDYTDYSGPYWFDQP
jgi:hypothetical protein